MNMIRSYKIIEKMEIFDIKIEIKTEQTITNRAIFSFSVCISVFFYGNLSKVS